MTDLATSTNTAGVVTGLQQAGAGLAGLSLATTASAAAAGHVPGWHRGSDGQGCCNWCVTRTRASGACMQSCNWPTRIVLPFSVGPNHLLARQAWTLQNTWARRCRRWSLICTTYAGDMPPQICYAVCGIMRCLRHPQRSHFMHQN